MVPQVHLCSGFSARRDDLMELPLITLLSRPQEEAIPFQDPKMFARFPALRRFHNRLGNTPLICVPTRRNAAKIYAKCEWHNPTGSIKARTAYAMLYAVLSKTSDAQFQRLKVLEYSGGNLSLALARLCRDLGIPLRLVLSSASPSSLLSQLKKWGAEVYLVDKERGFIAVIHEAVALSAEPSWMLLYQHRNKANLEFHALTTGREIIEELHRHRVDAWVASIGTGGTLIGVLQTLQQVNPDVKAYGVTPAELPYGSAKPPNGKPKYAGSGGLGNGIKQPFVAPAEKRLAGHFHYSYNDAIAAMGMFFDQTGVRIGSSSAANWLAAREVAVELGPKATVVTVFPCAGTPEEWEKLQR
jgi:cysteine synthase A